MKIALIGAGSSVGRHLLARTDDRFFGIYRSEKALSQLCDLDIGPRLARVADQAELVNALRGSDAAVSLINDENPRSALKSLIQAVDACELAGVPQLIHMSSAAIYGRNPQLARTVESGGPLISWNSYAAGKQWQENYLKRNMNRLTSTVILRPGLIWGPGMAWLHAPAGELLRREAWIVEGDALCNLVNINFLSHAILQLSELRSPGLSCSNIYDRERLTWAQYYHCIAEHLGIQADSIQVLPKAFIPPWVATPRAARYVFPLGIGWSVSPRPLKDFVKGVLRALPKGKASASVSLEPLDTAHLAINRELWELKTMKDLPPAGPILDDLYKSYTRTSEQDWDEVNELRTWMWV